jgi:hypothetical protein
VGRIVEDEFYVLFECPVYYHIRLKYEDALFTDFGGVSRVSRVIEAPGKVSALLEQEPQTVAALVWECVEYRQLRHQTYYLIFLGRKLSN